MPRRARLALPNVPLHIIQRGNNRQACFFADEDYRVYLDWLGEYANKTGCQIHAYVLMTNHVHLLMSAAQPAASGALMKALSSLNDLSVKNLAIHPLERSVMSTTLDINTKAMILITIFGNKTEFHLVIVYGIKKEIAK